MDAQPAVTLALQLDCQLRVIIVAGREVDEVMLPAQHVLAHVSFFSRNDENNPALSNSVMVAEFSTYSFHLQWRLLTQKRHIHTLPSENCLFVAVKAEKSVMRTDQEQEMRYSIKQCLKVLYLVICWEENVSLPCRIPILIKPRVRSSVEQQAFLLFDQQLPLTGLSWFQLFLSVGVTNRLRAVWLNKRLHMHQLHEQASSFIAHI